MSTRDGLRAVIPVADWPSPHQPFELDRHTSGLVQSESEDRCQSKPHH
jgi:hypothetical protein